MTTYVDTIERTQARSLVFTRTHRVLLFASAALWFMAFVLTRQRNYQDSWILEGVLVPFLIFAAAYVIAIIPERDTRVVALLSAGAAFVAAVVPALKYTQPYGVSIDATIHYLATQTIYMTGHGLDPEEVYASIPAMHSWLASMALMGGFTPAVAVKFGLPMMSGIYPLLIYWFTRGVRAPAPVARYSVAIACLTAFPDFVPSGSGFSVQAMLLLLGVLLLREYYALTRPAKVTYTVLALILLAQLTVWHSTTPLLLPISLAIVSMTPVVVHIVNRKYGSWRPNTAFLRFAILAAVVYVAYHVMLQDQVYKVMATTAYKLLAHKDTTAAVVPQRLFQITPLDILRVAVVIQGRDGIMVSLMGLGALMVWRFRGRWAPLLYFYVFLFLLGGAFFVMIGGAVTGLDYDRFLMVPVAISPFFAGVALWWLEQRLLVRPLRLRTVSRAVWTALLGVIFAVWLVEFFVYQPLVPKAKGLDPTAPREYVVWLQAVNTAYQERMLYFAETYTDPQSRFALDLTSQRQFWRYFGLDAGIRRGLALPLHWQVPLDDRIKFYLLHWPGVSGPLGEQVEDRSTAKITELRATPGWSLVYDNGQSFVMKIK